MMKQTGRKLELDVSDISLVGYYVFGVVGTTIGIIVVLIFNLFTPLEFTRTQFFILTGDGGASTGAVLFGRILPRLVIILLISYIPVMVGMNRMLRPIINYLVAARNGREPLGELRKKACRRLLNLPFMFVPLNVGMWILIPATIALFAYLTGQLDHRTAIILAARASLVGLIASAIVSHRIESYSRNKLIPYFFPEGCLTELKGTAKISISKRIRLVYRLGNVIPMIILLVTLLTLQWELDSSMTSAKEYGKGIIVFTLILFVYSFIATGTLNRAVSRSIVQPIKEMIRVLRNVSQGDFKMKVQVISNDEIGHIGDVINEMTDGLIERENLRRSLGLAREIQQSLLPEGNPDIEGLDIAGTSIYCDETGGDYYDYVESASDKPGDIRIAIGDVSGHGISSALLMATTRAFLWQRSSMPGSIGQVVSDVNRQLSRDVQKSGSFMTLFFISIDRKNSNLSWVRAGHDPALFYDPQTDHFSELKGKGIALGLDGSWEYAEETQLNLENGQIIVLYTDGIWEAHNGKGEMFGKAALRAVIRENAKLPAKQIMNTVIDTLSDFQEGTDSEDDVTLIVLKIVDLAKI